MPLSGPLKKEVELAKISHQQALQYGLTGGDDYELLFTISEANLCQLKNLYQGDISVIGTLVENREYGQTNSLIELLADKQPVCFSQQGWDHFQQGKS